MIKGAEISECGRYRWKLWRIWDDSKPNVLWIMHNPSTADGNEDDATIRRIINFSRDWGYGGLYVGNVFPYRETNPKEMKKKGRSVYHKNENIDHIREMMAKCELYMLAYGNPIAPIHLPVLFEGEFHYLKLTKDGYPGHPLYLEKYLKPILMTHEKNY